MKKTIKLLGILAGAAMALTAFLYRKKHQLLSRRSKRSNRPANTQTALAPDDAYDLVKKEVVPIGRYDGSFYEDSNGHRVYLPNY